jgi:hypothetical protein
MIDVANSRVSKRTLTKKSKWEFSKKYEGYTVEQIMEIHPITLYWGYTHLEKIDFNDEILEFLEDRYKNTFVKIIKPNIDKDQFQNLIGKFYGGKTLNSMNYLELKKAYNFRKAKNLDISNNLLDALKFAKINRIATLTKNHGITKESLARKNQGHKI